MAEDQKPKTIKEALGSRADQAEAPPQTMDEITEQALSDANVEAQYNDQYPEGPAHVSALSPSSPNPLPVEEQETPPEGSMQPPTTSQEMTTPPAENTNSQPETEPLTIPASIIKSQPVTESGSPVLVDSKKTNQPWDKLKAFVFGDQFSANWCRLHLLNISRIPKAIPSPTLWNVPAGFDISQEVYTTIQVPGYIESLWASLEVVMGSSIDNVEWACGVLCTLTVFDVIRVLPYLDDPEQVI